MGVVDKVYLEFPNPWLLDKHSAGIGFLYKDPINYDMADANRDWTRFCLGVYPVLHRPNLLFLWLSGPGALVMESKSEKEVQDEVMTLLRKFLSKEYGLIPDPTDIKVSE